MVWKTADMRHKDSIMGNIVKEGCCCKSCMNAMVWKLPRGAFMVIVGSGAKDLSQRCGPECSRRCMGPWSEVVSVVPIGLPTLKILQGCCGIGVVRCKGYFEDLLWSCKEYYEDLFWSCKGYNESLMWSVGQVMEVLTWNLWVLAVGIKPRQKFLMADVGAAPVLLRLASCSEASQNTIWQMAREKMAALVHLKTFDFALIPHTNQKNSLHIVGLKVWFLMLITLVDWFPVAFLLQMCGVDVCELGLKRSQ
jgi:hypothetical protein